MIQNHISEFIIMSFDPYKMSESKSGGLGFSFLILMV